MWTRYELKSNAKFVLKKNYFYVLGFYLVYLLLSGKLITIIKNINEQMHYFNPYSIHINGFSIPYSWIYGLGILTFCLTIGFVLLHTFIFAPLEIGYRRFYLINRDITPKFTTLFFSFSKAEYLNIVKILFLKNIKIVLWSFLFIIPGLIKSYEYRMIPYILAENPALDSKRVFTLTHNMTYGNKINMWILDLSFIGWYILGSFLIIGKVFVDVYADATLTELYTVLKDRLIDDGFSNYEELPGVFTDL